MHVSVHSHWRYLSYQVIGLFVVYVYVYMCVCVCVWGGGGGGGGNYKLQQIVQNTGMPHFRTDLNSYQWF